MRTRCLGYADVLDSTNRSASSRECNLRGQRKLENEILGETLQPVSKAHSA